MIQAWALWLWLAGMAAPWCGDAVPCSCRLNTVEDEFARSHAVFSGVVVRVGELTRDSIIPAGETRVDSTGVMSVSLPIRADDLSWPVTLRVDAAWKGAAAGDSVGIADLGGCPVGFRVGEAYLVYAVRDDQGVLRTSYCMRTRALQVVRDDVRALDSIAPRS